MTDRKDYEYWEKAVYESEFGPVHEGEPQAGFYRMKAGKKGQERWVPVAIWRNKKGQMVALANGQPADVGDIWLWACQHPVLEKAYNTALADGTWPDLAEAVTESLKPIDRHHNEPPDELRILADQIESALAGVDKYTEIKTDEQLNAAQSLRSRLLELSGAADKQREIAKGPHLKKAREVDALFMPLVKGPKAGADKVKAGMTAFLNSKIAEAEAAKGEEDIALAAPADAPPLPQIKGAYGRKATTELVRVGSGITNIDELFAWPPMHNHPELHDAMLRLAQKAIDKGLSPPGVRIVEEAKIR